MGGGGETPTKIIFFWEILFWIAVRFSPLHRRLPLFLFSAPLTSSLVKPARGHYCCVTWAWLRVRMSHAVCSFRLFYLRGIGNVKKRKKKKMIHFKFSNEKKKKKSSGSLLLFIFTRDIQLCLFCDGPWSSLSWHIADDLFQTISSTRGITNFELRNETIR